MMSEQQSPLEGITPRSPLDIPRCVTFFASHTAQTKREETLSMRALTQRLESAHAPEKKLLPWLKLAAFGNLRTPSRPDGKGGNSLRHDENLLCISGIEADYDGETLTMERARTIVGQANLAAILYTSPSHTAAAPRWRVLCPTSAELPPSTRTALMARLNGLFLGALAGESFTLSQSYYFGFVDGATDHQVICLDGRCIDEAPDLDAGAVGKPEKPRLLPMGDAPRLELGASWHGGSPYGRKALEGECNAIRAAAEGQKHPTLNRAAYSIGGLVAANELNEAAAMAELRNALGDIRHRCEDFTAAERTLIEAFDAGKAAPRQAPPPRERKPRYPEAPPYEEMPDHMRGEPDYDPETGEILEGAEPVLQDRPSTKKPTDDAPLELLDPTGWNTPPPARRWIVESWIPVGVVSAKYGDGGIGKTLSAQQLMTSVALGVDWLGLPVTQGRTLGIFCEDDEDELHRRQIAINRAYGVEMQDLEHMRLLSRLGEDNSLVHYEPGGNYLTAFHARLMAACDLWRPDLLVLDTAADLYPDNENDRSKVRWFIQAGLARIAREFQCAVLLLAHPSVSGLTSGTGTGGSTAWNNTVRSRIYLSKEEGEDAHPDARIMSRKKSNYAAKGGDIRLTWQEGVLVPENGGGNGFAATVPWSTISAIFDEIERAWKSEKAWSNAFQAKPHGRYMPSWIKFQFGIAEKAAGKMLSDWQTTGCLITDTHNTDTKATGLRVLRRPDQ